jgi:DNA-binding NarL/FixJ family response regulator
MNPSRRITVLLAEDHAVVRQGLRALLAADSGFEIVGEACTGREAVDLARTLRPEVILMDIAMPMLNGVEATRQILAVTPKARVVILSAYSDQVYVDRLTKIGVFGFLEKQSSAEILTKAIREVARGHAFFSPTIARRLAAKAARPRDREGALRPNDTQLTSREAEVLQLVAEGFANKQAAAELRISVKTVEKHRQNLMNKLNIHDTAGLTRYAIAAGVIESSVRAATP